MDIKARAKQLQTDIPAVFLALKDKRTPLRARLIGAVAVGYALSPIDLIPDFIPVLGYLDDVILLPLLVALTIKMIPPPVFEEHRENAKSLWEAGKPKKWYFAIPIVAVWLAVGLLILRAVRR